MLRGTYAAILRFQHNYFRRWCSTRWPVGWIFILAVVTIDEIESDLNLWYLDDGTLCDVPEVVLEDFHQLIQLSKERGLEVNPSKCEIYFCSGVVDTEILRKFQEIAPGIRVINEENLCLLGAPIFESAFTTVASSFLNTADVMFDRLKNLSAHTAFFLLKNCFAIPKLTYLLRSFPAWKFKDFTSAFDSLIKTTLESILNIRLDENSWKHSKGRRHSASSFSQFGTWSYGNRLPYLQPFRRKPCQSYAGVDFSLESLEHFIAVAACYPTKLGYHKREKNYKWRTYFHQPIWHRQI